MRACEKTLLHTIIAKGGSAASNHYWALRDSDVLDDIRTYPNGPVVILPDTSTLQAMKKAIFPHLQSSLVSLCQL